MLLDQTHADVRQEVIPQPVVLQLYHFANLVVVFILGWCVSIWHLGLFTWFFGLEVEPDSELERVVLVGFEAEAVGAEEVAISATSVAHEHLLVLLDDVLGFRAQAEVAIGVSLVKPRVILLDVFLFTRLKLCRALFIVSVLLLAHLNHLLFPCVDGLLLLDQYLDQILRWLLHKSFLDDCSFLWWTILAWNVGVDVSDLG